MSKKLLITLIVIIVLLGGGTAAFVVMDRMDKPAPAEQAKVEPKDMAECLAAGGKQIAPQSCELNGKYYVNPDF